MIYFFHEAARVEQLELVAYYESCRIGLGTRYLSAFDEAMGAICEAPDRYRVEFPPAIRKYRIVDSDIEVLVVAPHRRRPGYWAGRL